VLAREPNSRFFLFYGNRSTAGMLFLEELEELKDRFIQRLSLFHVISGEEQDIPILHGRLTAKSGLLSRWCRPRRRSRLHLRPSA
jgi:ring-1,2-phenylacetyl-CoA epoxidase subunit PaaE